MKFDRSITELIKKRHSVRNYTDKPVTSDQQHQLGEFITTLDNPFGQSVKFHLLDRTVNSEAQKLGTYGVIQGCQHFVGATVGREGLSLEALGFEFETVLLYLTSLGLGTCWLGGTFNRQGFAGAMDVAPDELFPIISPYGYGSNKLHLKEKALRALARSDSRKDATELFFQDDFKTPLTLEKSGSWTVPLEMVRLGPSASNKQPWRVLLLEDTLHFYEYKSPGYSTAFAYDIQRIDMGIAAAHFYLTAQELQLSGHFEHCPPDVASPSNFIYEFSWIPDTANSS